jgi:hypothetical protein
MVIGCFMMFHINLKFHENFGNNSIIVEGSLEDQIARYIVLIGYPCGKYEKTCFQGCFLSLFLIQVYDAKKAHHMLSLMERMKLGFDCYLVVNLTYWHCPKTISTHT